MKTVIYIKIARYPARSSFLYTNGYILEVFPLPVYPLASIAIAKSDDLRTVSRNKGSNNVMTPLHFSNIFPSSNFAPLAACASIKTFHSSNIMGMNLNAIITMTAISCTGIPVFSNPENAFSKPSASSFGVEV